MSTRGKTKKIEFLAELAQNIEMKIQKKATRVTLKILRHLQKNRYHFGALQPWVPYKKMTEKGFFIFQSNLNAIN